MTCHETRERLSEFLEDALASPERGLVRAHLDGCPDCRQELDRLGALVSLLSRVERPRAPVGFVDRVTVAVRGVPWYLTLGRRLFRPLNVKLPAHAAAMLLIAILGVYLLQRTPELRDAARPESQSHPVRSEPSVTTVVPPPQGPPRPEPTAGEQRDPKAGKPGSGRVSEPAPGAGREREDGPRREAREFRQEAKMERDTDRLRQAGSPAESHTVTQDAVKGAAGTASPPPPAVAARRQSAASGVHGRLIATNRAAIDRDLSDLLARLGGTETGRRQELGATVVDVLVPEARYADLVSGLGALGAFTAEGQPVTLPSESAQVRVSIRILE